MKSFIHVLVITSILIAVLFGVFPGGIKQISGQNDENNDNDTEMSNSNTITGNNTIILDPAEVNGTYRWVNNSGGINPTLQIAKGNEYVIKINNPTDEEHELVIEDSKGSKIDNSEEVQPGKNIEFKFKTEESDDLNYHCEYHPETMKGKVNIIESP
ncbi:MAG TPA: cupredoxin domain-containing protein [Nitrososphaeraceae archaeon]|nr:cupredoxin domain-containing protein [Nitrososphaeraceae archaeon]